MMESYFKGPHEPSLGAAAPTAGELLRGRVRRHAQRIAIREPVHRTNSAVREWTYAQLLCESERVARALMTLFRSGERIAVWAAAKPEWTMLQLGASLAGITLVTLNPANRRRETLDLLTRSKVSGLFLDNDYRGFDMRQTIEELKASLPLLREIRFFTDWNQFIELGNNSNPLPNVDPDSPSLIVFTSGTTGAPKGVVLRHAGTVMNAMRSTARFELPEGAVWLNLLPLFHVGGSVSITLGCFSNGGTLVMLPEFNPELVLRSISEERASIAMLVPTMIIALTERPELPTMDLSSLHCIISGGTTVAPEVVRLVREKLGVGLHVVFGQTEAGGILLATVRNDTEEHVCETAGKPLADTEVQITDPATGNVQPVGEPGEICIRGAWIMSEYFEDPVATTQTLIDGWVHTGDLGAMQPDGYLRVVGRLKDMIIRGGENIYPREVEDALIEHPDVLEAAVFGLPDARWGEQVAAAVRLAPGVRLDEDGLASYLQDRLARHKVPKIWWAVDTLPLVGLGKVQKFLLREQYLARTSSD